MADIIKWTVILVCPGEEELPLLAALTSRSDAQVVAVADPDPNSLGVGLAEVMGVSVISDPAQISLGQAQYLVYPALSEAVVPYVDLAGELGYEALTTREFVASLENPVRLTPQSPIEPLPTLDAEGLESESAAIHRTLSRIEEALDREGLLRWLLGLAIRATGADSGSIMLLDSATEELYVAFGEGLSQQTMLNTRVKLGEGIAGRVALSRKSELINSNQHPGARRDRSGQSSAVCAPLVWEGRLLGVLNLNTAPDAGELNTEALAVVNSLGHRFGLILDRFLRIQRVRDGELFRIMEEGLLKEKRNPEALAVTLCAWAKDLAEVAGAKHVELSVLTVDGDLFTASAEDSHYESPPAKTKLEVISTGKAKVLNPGDLSDQDPVDVLREGTTFYLPVGTNPVRALFSLEFTSPTKAHQFRSICSDILNLVGRHLENYLDRVEATDQIDRLTTLASALSDLVMFNSMELSQQKVLATIMRLTGAENAALIASALPDPTGPIPAKIAEAGLEMLNQLGKGPWQSTILTGPGEDCAQCQTILALPIGHDDIFPGVILWGKQRLHPLDAASFTEMDVLFARRLLPLITMVRPKVENAGQPAPAMPAPRAEESLAADDILTVLRREMDRCDRYHTCLGLTAYRPVAGGPSGFQPALMVDKLAAHLRSSDRVFAWGDDTLLVLVPEDVQSLPRLQKRLMSILKDTAPEHDLDFHSAVRTYPGSANSPTNLMESVLGALD